MNAKNPISAYKETQIRTAGPGKIVVMLYDAILKNVRLAMEHCERKDIEKIHASIIKAQDIVTELMASLDFERGGDIAKNLFSVYVYVNKQLMEANLHKNRKPLDAVLPLMQELRDAWAVVADKADVKVDDGPGVNIAG